MISRIRRKPRQESAEPEARRSRIRAPQPSTPPEKDPEVIRRRIRRVRPSEAGKTDGRTRYIIDWGMSWGAKLQLYLMTSFLYYQMNRSVITDTEFDRLCDDLREGWDDNDHPHKRLIGVHDLEATTGFAIRYPLRVRNAALYMLELHREV